MRFVLMAKDNTFYKSESTRYGATLEDAHIFQNGKQALKVKDRLDKFYAETTYVPKPVQITLI